MSEELLYTSAARGLKAGARGFCTVEATAGMPPTTAQLLESLSGYRHLHAPGDPANPVVLRHVIAKVAGAPTHILSRIADAGLDYSGRSNKIAHHVALPPGGLNEAGPAWSQLQGGFHKKAWSGETQTIPAGPSVPAGNVPPAPCRTWAAVTGDAGWAGVLAGAVAAGGLTPLPIVVRADQDLLPLLSEAIALLPPALRWQATYTTFHTQLPPGTQCAWRFVLEGTKEAEETLKRRDLNQLDLRQPLGPPPQGPWVEAARTGERPVQPSTHTVKGSPPGQAEAPPSIDEPAELDVEAPGRESHRTVPPPPPPPGRRVPYSTRGDFSQQSPKQSIGPLVVALLALLAIGMIGAAVAVTMIPKKRVASGTFDSKENTKPQSKDQSESQQDDTQTSGEAVDNSAPPDASRSDTEFGADVKNDEDMPEQIAKAPDNTREYAPAAKEEASRTEKPPSWDELLPVGTSFSTNGDSKGVAYFKFAHTATTNLSLDAITLAVVASRNRDLKPTLKRSPTSLELVGVDLLTNNTIPLASLAIEKLGVRLTSHSDLLQLPDIAIAIQSTNSKPTPRVIAPFAVGRLEGPASLKENAKLSDLKDYLDKQPTIRIPSGSTAEAFLGSV